MSMLLRKLLGHTLMDAAVDKTTGAGAGSDDENDENDGRPDDITPEEWDALTEAERAAIRGDDDEPHDLDAGREAETLRKIAEGDVKASDATPGAAAAADEDDGPATVVQSPYRAELPADHKDKVDANAKAIKDLGAKFRAGEIDIDEYETQRDALDTERAELNNRTLKASLAAEMSEQAASNAWDREVSDFMSQAENAIYKSKAANVAFDALVRDVVSDEALKAHPERQKWSGRRILIEADKQFRADMGLAAPAADGGKPNGDKPLTAKEKAAAALKARQQDADKRPRTLRDIPAADQDVTGTGEASGEFAELEGLQGIAYENALARMERSDPAKFERYMRG